MSAVEVPVPCSVCGRPAIGLASVAGPRCSLECMASGMSAGTAMTNSKQSLSVEEAAFENVALRCLMGGGCDANSDGPHTAMGNGRDEFCINCGEMTRNGKSKPWLNEARLERTIARLRSRSPLEDNSNGCVAAD